MSNLFVLTIFTFSIHLIKIWPLIYAHSKLALVASFKIKHFKLKNEASRANLNKNKKIFKWRPFWNKVYRPNA